MGLFDAVSFVQRLKEQGCIDERTIKVVNHFSHNGEMTHVQLEDFAKERGMLAAYDGMKVSF